MTRIAPIAGALLAAAMLIALLVTAAPATASPPGASVVLDQPEGFADPFTGAGGYSDTGSARSASADGRYVAFMRRTLRPGR